MGSIKSEKLPKEIRKQLTKDYSQATALPRFIGLRYVEAQRARNILLDPNSDLDLAVRAGLETYYLNKLSWVVGASTGWISGILTAGFAGEAIVSRLGTSSWPLGLVTAVFSGFSFYLLTLVGAKKFFGGSHLARLRENYPNTVDANNL